MNRRCALVVGLSLAATAANAAAQPSPAGPAGSISGRVIRPDGIPQPDAEVVTATRGRDGRLQTLSWRTRTAFDGRYEIRDVPEGRYLVLVRTLGSDAPMQGRPLATLFPGVADSEAGVAVTVFAGVPVEGIDIWLLPSPRRFQVSGRVVDHEGRDLENVSIEFGFPRTRADSVWTLTEPGGLFALEGVPPGSIVLRARADGPTGPLIGVVSTDLAIESPQDVRIVVRDPGCVHGRVQVPGGGPVPAGLRLALVPTLLRPSALFPAEPASPDASGRFALAGGPGEHELIVEGLPPGWTVLRIHQGTSTAQLATLWLSPGTTLENVGVDIGPRASAPRLNPTGR